MFIPESMLKHTSTTMALTRDLQNQIEIELNGIVKFLREES